MASFEAEHLLTVRSSAGRIPAAAVGLYGTEAVVATAGRDKQLQLHRPFCKTHEVSTYRQLSMPAASLISRLSRDECKFMLSLPQHQLHAV